MKLLHLQSFRNKDHEFLNAKWVPEDLHSYPYFVITVHAQTLKIQAPPIDFYFTHKLSVSSLINTEFHLAYFHSFLQIGRILAQDTPAHCAAGLEKQQLNIFLWHLKPGWDGDAFIWTAYYIK